MHLHFGIARLLLLLLLTQHYVGVMHTIYGTYFMQALRSYEPFITIGTVINDSFSTVLINYIIYLHISLFIYYKTWSKGTSVASVASRITLTIKQTS